MVEEEGFHVLVTVWCDGAIVPVGGHLRNFVMHPMSRRNHPIPSKESVQVLAFPAEG